MNISELSIGSWVHSDTAGDQQIVEIEAINTNKDTRRYLVKFDNPKRSDFADLVTPIPLTEAIFKKNDYNVQSMAAFKWFPQTLTSVLWVVRDYQKDRNTLSIHNETNLKRLERTDIKYIHEFQRSLTDMELFDEALTFKI